jgi:hypothetical protein
MRKWLFIALLFLSNCGKEEYSYKRECLFNLYQDGHNANCGGIRLVKTDNHLSSTPAANPTNNSN